MNKTRNGVEELRSWIKRNAEHFRNYKTDEIVNLAIACGFHREAIATWQSEIELRMNAEFYR